MRAPPIVVRYAREDRGEEPMEITLCPPPEDGYTAKQVAGWWADNRVRLYMGRLYPINQKQQRQWLQEQAGAEDGMHWGIYVGETLIGMVGLSDIDGNHRRAQFGIIIGQKQHWGRGIGPTAGVAVLQHAFNDMAAGGLNKVTASVIAGNARSNRALRKMGFREIGLEQSHCWFQGRWHDSRQVEMLRTEWTQRQEEIFRTVGITEIEYRSADLTGVSLR
ncbi:MAG: GNAT family N-acetyltransferase [Armatimonadota bacterium]